MGINFRNKDFWSGMMLLGIGLGAGYIASGYPMGSVLRMGSGYFPMILSGLLAAFGVALIIRALATSESIAPGWSFKALILLPIVFALFGYLMDRAGFVPAMTVLIFGAALAGNEFKFVEVLLLTIVLTALSIGIFLYGLGLPYQAFIWPPRFGH